MINIVKRKCKVKTKRDVHGVFTKNATTTESIQRG